MSYPATDPVNAVRNAWGAGVPAGWEATPHFSPAVEGAAVENKSLNIVTTSLRAPDGLGGWLDRIADWASLGGQNPELAAGFYRGLRNFCSHYHWLLGINPATTPGFLLQGSASVNFTERISFKATVEGGGLVLRINNLAGGGYANPRKIEVNLKFTPWYYSDSGEAEYTTATLSLTPGWEVRTGLWGPRSRIRKITASSASETVCELTQPLPEVVDATVYAYGEVGDPERWPRIQPARGLWTTRKDSGWVATPVAIAMNLGDGLGNGRRIARPLAWGYDGTGYDRTVTYKGTLRIEVATSASAPAGEFGEEDLAATVIAGWPGADSALWTQRTFAGGFLTYLDLSWLDASVTWVRVFWCPEADIEDLEDLEGRTRGLRGCTSNRHDPTGSLGNAADIVYTAIDASGEHWHCAKAHEGALLSEYDAECEATRCPHYAPMADEGGWQPNLADWRQLWLGKNICVVQYIAGVTQYYLQRGWGGVPSLTWLAGQREEFLIGLYRESVDRLGNGVLGYIDWSATPYARRVQLAIEADGMGTLAQAAGVSDPPDPLGGESIEDGTDHAEIARAWPGLMGEAPWTGLGHRDAAGGTSVTARQRMVTRRFTLRGIDLSAEKVGVEQEFVGGHRATHWVIGAADYIEVRLAREFTLGDRAHIPASAKYVVGASLSVTYDTATLYFAPGVERCEFWVQAQLDATSEYAQCGLTVDPTEDKKPTNPAVSTSAGGFGMLQKARRGCTLRFSTAPWPYNQIRVTALAAQAYGGPDFRTFSTSPLALSGSATAEHVMPGAWRPDGTTEDPIGPAYSFTGIKFQDGTWRTDIEEAHLGQWDLDDTKAAHAVDWNGVNEGNGQTIPGRSHVAAALAAFLGGYPPKNLAKLAYSTHYRLSGDVADRTGAGVLYQETADGEGTAIQTLPAVPLAGTPDWSAAVGLEWWDERTGEWSLPSWTLTFEGVRTGADVEWELPEENHCFAYQKSGRWFVALPTEYWGYRVRVTYWYDATAGVGVDLDAPAQGTGFPSGFNDWRLNMDAVTVSLRGYKAQELVSWFASTFGGFPGLVYPVEVDWAAVLPPDHLATAGGIADVTRALDAVHLERTGVATVEAEEPLTGYEIDRANGLLKIDVADWDRSEGIAHDLYVCGDFLDMVPDCPAELFTGARAVARALEWADWTGGMASSAMTVALLMCLVPEHEGLPELPDFPCRWQTKPGIEYEFGGVSDLDAWVPAGSPSHNIGHDYRTEWISVVEYEGSEIGAHAFLQHGTGADDYLAVTLTVPAAFTPCSISAMPRHGLQMLADVELNLVGGRIWEHHFWVDDEGFHDPHPTGEPLDSVEEVSVSFAKRDALGTITPLGSVGGLAPYPEGGVGCYRGTVDVTWLALYPLAAGEEIGLHSFFPSAPPGSGADGAFAAWAPQVEGTIVQDEGTGRRVIYPCEVRTRWTWLGSWSLGGCKVKFDTAAIEAEAPEVFCGTAPVLENPV